MPLGGATKKIQKILDTAEELYNRIVELREQVMEVRETVQDTNARVATLENKLDQQGAILEALAEHEGIDVDELVTEVAIEEAEPEDGEGNAASHDGSADGDGSIPDAETGDGSAG
ncbi:DUF5798 family protein [Natronomonas marina]|jgi:chromosome segregation ATPase|uniref:DUF5798 family protein n=1 Tax=Natronomonas marina TaxID=2961939 RepID=UPI0020C9B66F|nr:DUF5798 family protein [Natronomonas marina]